MTDTAKATFSCAIERAKFLLTLFGFLHNQRRNAVKKGWKDKFCEIAYWPKKSKVERVDGKKMMLLIQEGGTLKSKNFSEEGLSDLLRASLVMAVSAVDAYFHAKIVAHVAKLVRKGDDMPNRLAAHKITVGDFLDAQDRDRPMMVLRQSIEASLGFQSLQQPTQIADGLALLGVANFWSQVARHFGESDKKVKNHLTKIVGRRNQIAHEGDLSQSTKARNQSRNLSPGEVEKAIDFSQKLVEASEKIINDAIK